MENLELDKILISIMEEEIQNLVVSENEKVHIMFNGEPIDTFENEDDANIELAEYKKCNPNKEYTIKRVAYGETDYIDKLDEMGETLEIKEKDMSEKKECRCGKSLKITETQVKKLTKILMEDIPGLKAVKDAHVITDKETSDHISDVDMKIANFQDIDGNDNPEFPNQIDSSEKIAKQNSDEEDNIVADKRGGKPLDLNYENSSGEQFEDRVEKAMTGDSIMGNPSGDDVVNITPSEVGKNMLDDAKRKKEKLKNQPLYVKDKQPITTVNESLEDDMRRMLRIASYNTKTQ